jgi:hypothetical protein
MAKFLKGNELNSELEKIIDNAEEELLLISPYVKLHSRIKDSLKAKADLDGLEIVVVFGKNSVDKTKSLSREDLDFLKTFPNIEIRYEERLHAKYYANENAAILTSMNLHEFSHNNNIEFGILTKVSSEQLDEDAFDYFTQIIDNSEPYFKREPKYKNGWMGLTKDYLNSEITLDKFDNTVKQGTFIDVRKSTATGYCIRTGRKIRFNHKRPFSSPAFKDWAKTSNPDFPEAFCHFSGEKSNGETRFSKPILKKNWSKAKETHQF